MTYSKDSITFEPFPRNGKFRDITGKQYARLTVLGYAGKTNMHHYWWCQCMCGQIKRIRPDSLRNMDIQSCGCLKSEQDKQTWLTHGMARTVEYRLYAQARQRCTNPRHQNFEQYGAKGIEFRFTSFEEFFAEMGFRPTPHHSIDRYPNNAGHYEPGNVRWATKTEQANNRHTTIYMVFQDRTQSLSDWCRELHLKPSRVRGRKAAGWSDVDALTLPFQLNQFG